jgi:esterase/lipase superfamily enzyme
MGQCYRLLIIAYFVAVFGSVQPVSASPSDDVKSYVAAVDASDWKGAADAADRLLAYYSGTLALSSNEQSEPDTLALNSNEQTEMVRLAAEAAERAGLFPRAITLNQRLVSEVEAGDGPTSYSLVAPLRKLADLLAAQGQLDAAAPLYDRAISISQAELGSENPALLSIYLSAQGIDQRRLAADNGQQSGNAVLLERKLASQQFIIKKLAQGSGAAGANGQEPIGGARATPGSDDPAFQLVTVHYGTNRQPTGTPEPTQFYGIQRGPLVLGIAAVSVPKARTVGETRLPQFWSGDFRPDAAKRFILTKVTPSASTEAFVTSARTQIERSKRREALVFIHGYNSDFERSAHRAAQLAVDLNIDGAVFMYDWPSKGSIFSYVADGAEVIRPLVRSLGQFLNIIVREIGADRVHVVAHSMGNRYLLEALDLLSRENQDHEQKPMFQEMVFAAPDVDADDFVDRVQHLGWMAHRMTLYASSKDRALQISSMINGGYLRAGDTAAAITVPGLDSVDTTEVSGDGLGHGDYADRALDDLRSIVWLSLQPKSRCLLVDKSLPTGAHFWQLAGDPIHSCPSEAFETAISLTRSLGPADAHKFLQSKLEATRKENDPLGEAHYAAILTIFDMVK